jgi:hypothetical protein
MCPKCKKDLSPTQKSLNLLPIITQPVDYLKKLIDKLVSIDNTVIEKEDTATQPMNDTTSEFTFDGDIDDEQEIDMETELQETSIADESMISLEPEMEIDFNMNLEEVAEIDEMVALETGSEISLNEEEEATLTNDEDAELELDITGLNNEIEAEPPVKDTPILDLENMDEDSTIFYTTESGSNTVVGIKATEFTDPNSTVIMTPNTITSNYSTESDHDIEHISIELNTDDIELDMGDMENNFNDNKEPSKDNSTPEYSLDFGDLELDLENLTMEPDKEEKK